MRIVLGLMLFLVSVPMAWLPGAHAQPQPRPLEPQRTPELDARGKAAAEHHGRVMAEYRERARRELLAETKSESRLDELAAERLRRAGADVFQLQRVELTGFWSPARDDVEKRDRLYFDQRIALSNLELPPDDAGLIAKLWRKYWNVRVKAPMDAWQEVRYDRKGILSARAMEQLQGPLSNVAVREIWAHSWATDAIYNAILKGVVLPPKRLVLMGLPSRNQAKWESLARATGTDVYIFGYDQDFVSRLPIDFKGAGIVVGAADFPGALTQDANELARTWNAWAIQNASRRRPGAKPGTVSTLWTVPESAGFFGHERDRYHDYVIHSLQWVVPVAELARMQARLIMDERARMVDERTARLLAEHPPPAFQDPAFAAARPAIQVPRAVAAQPPAPVVIRATVEFAAIFPRLKEFAVTACRSSRQVSLPTDVYQTYYAISYSQARDGPAADRLSVGMGNCERQLFHKLIEMVRAGQGSRIDEHWVQGMVSQYQPRQEPARHPGPGTGRIPPPQEGCFMQSNPFGAPYRVCPKN